jgi:hypothetical protein
MAKLVAAGKMKWRETIYDGIEKAPEAFPLKSLPMRHRPTSSGRLRSWRFSKNLFDSLD